MRISTNDKNTLDRNPGDGTMNSSSVTAFLLSPHWRIYRHILLQVAVLLITINVFWYEPLQVVSLLKRFGGCLVYFLSMNAVIYTNLYILVPSFLLKNRLGGYVLAADLPLSSTPFRGYLLWVLSPQVRRLFHCSLIGCVIICALISWNLPLCNRN